MKRLRALLVTVLVSLSFLAFSTHAIAGSKRAAKSAYKQGVERGKAGDFDGAIMYFKKAVKNDSRYSSAWRDLGLAYQKTGQFAEAAKVIGVVITRSPSLSPKARTAKCKPAVALLTAIAYLQPIYSENLFSKVLTTGP